MDNIDISFGDDVLIGHGNGVTIDDYNDNVISSETLVGPQGPPGPPGFSPVANVTQTQDGVIVRITDETGTTSANIYNGNNGISPNATVTQTASGATISITDAQGTTTATVNNGEDGDPGDNATITIGQVSTLAPGSQATVSNVGTDTNAVLDFGIPEGLKGDQGEQGEPGINARAYVTQNTGSATITIEDADGITTATVYDGQDGTNGTDGVSPIATVTPTATGATISITDAQGTTTANITNGIDGTDGTDGTDGVTPVISATASVDNTTGTPSVTVTKSGTDVNPSFAFAFTNLKGDSGADWYSCYVSVAQPSGNISVNGTAFIQTITLTDGTWRLMWGYRLVQQITANVTRYVNAGLRNVTGSSDVFMTGINVSSDQDGYIRSMINQSAEVTVSGTTQFASVLSNSTLGGTGTITANTCYLYAIKVND